MIDFRAEDIELQILPSKQQPSTSGVKAITSYTEANTLPSTDAESLESTEFPQIDIVDGTSAKLSTIGNMFELFNMIYLCKQIDIYVQTLKQKYTGKILLKVVKIFQVHPQLKLLPIVNHLLPIGNLNDMKKERNTNVQKLTVA